MTLGAFAEVLPSVRRFRFDLGIALVAATVAQALGIPLALLTRWTINRAAVDLEAGASAASLQGLLLTFGAVFAGLTLLRGAMRWVQTLRSERAAQGVLADLRGRMYQHLQRLSQGYFDRRPTGKILIRFIGDANSLRTWVARTLITVPADVLTVVGVGLALALIEVEFLVAAAIPLVVVVPVLVWVNPRARHWTREGRRSQTRLAGLLGERVPAMAVTKALNAQEADATQAQSLIEAVAGANVRRARLDAWTQAVAITGSTAALGALAAWGIWLLVAGEVNQGDLVGAVWLALLSRGPISRLARANIVHQRARVAADRIAALLAREPEPGWSDALPAWTGRGHSIELKRIGYRDTTGSWLIRGLDLEIDGPALVAVSDEIGRAAGVLLELLLRLRRPHEGRILLDGQDARRVRVADIRRHFGWLDRPRRILEVAALVARDDGSPDAALYEAVWSQTDAIAPRASLQTCLKALSSDAAQCALAPDAQLRIALCCAMLHAPRVLLLDDPSAGLNPRSTERLVDWLSMSAQSRLVLVVTSNQRILARSSRIIGSRQNPEECFVTDTRP